MPTKNNIDQTVGEITNRERDADGIENRIDSLHLVVQSQLAMESTGAKASPTGTTGIEDTLARVFTRAHFQGSDALSLDDWIMLGQEASVRQELKRQDLRRAELDRIGRMVLVDLDPNAPVDADSLTAFFARKAKLAEHKRDPNTNRIVEHGEVLPDDKKAEVIELIRAWRAAGGTVRYNGKECVMNLRQPKDMKQKRFEVRETSRERKKLVSSKSVQPLIFSL